MRTLSGRKRTLRRAKFVMNSGRTYQTECIVEDAANDGLDYFVIEPEGTDIYLCQFRCNMIRQQTII